MARLKGIDIAWERPTIAQIKATSAHWVARYLSPDKTKNLTAAEVHDYVAAGLAVVTVWESAAGRALQSFYAGQQDAQAAEAQRKALGLPGDHVIHFAVDTDTNWTSVWPYFQGVLSVLPIARTGVYGGINVINGAHAQGFRYLWQTVAWSGGQWSAHATIRQPGGTLLGGAADVDYAQVPDFGQYPRPTPPTPVEPDMPLTDADATKVAAATTRTILGTALPVVADDKNTTRSLAAVVSRQETLQRETLAQVTAQGKQITALQEAVAALVQHLTP